MARTPAAGTPSRGSRYVFPAKGNRLTVIGALLAVVTAIVLIGAYRLGFRRTLSPGPLARAHASIDMRCAQCHTERAAVADLRCERCHDQTGSQRLTNNAHVMLGSGDSHKADRAPALPCVTCHVEHHGRETAVAAVDDRECGRCHAFHSFSSHPEFSVVRAGTSTGLGLRFPHDRHIADSRRATGVECRSCHEPTADRRSFEPIDFDRHCARCHLERRRLTGQTEPLHADAIVLPEAVPELAALPVRPDFRDAGRGRIEARGLVHRDPWLLYNARRLGRALDTDGELMERTALSSRIEWIQQQLRARPIASVPDDQLPTAITQARRDLQEIDARLSRGPRPGDDDRALAQMAALVQGLSRQLQQADTGEDSVGAAALATNAIDLRPPAVPRDDAAAVLFERRRAELLKLLQAIAARPDGALHARADALRRQVEALRFDASAPEADRAALQERLRSLDDILRTLSAATDPTAQFGAAQLDALRRLAADRVNGGLAADEFELRRQELLSLLDAIDARAGDTVHLRVSGLRARVLAIRPGNSGDDDLVRERQRRKRLLDRLWLEQELAAAGDRAGAPSADDATDRRGVETTLARLQKRLAALQGGGRINAAATAQEREHLSTELTSLLAGCVKCHEVSGARMAPVTVAEPVLTRSVFSHAPHITLVSCDSCHRSVRLSKVASDVNIPGVATCQTCHTSGQAGATCRSCHVYHPKSLGHLVTRG